MGLPQRLLRAKRLDQLLVTGLSPSEITPRAAQTSARERANVAAKKLVPYGKPIPRSTAGKKSTRAGNSAKPTADSATRSMGGMSRDPQSWFIVGQKRASATVPTSNDATKRNAIVNKAFQRGGYAG